ncbi:hypothetical protein [Blattabacterium cuenoti]|nr:hypothetical protein [Blattabacterium cuenoti]
MKKKGKKIFDKVIKKGKYFLEDPVSSVFLLDYEKNSSINLIGTLVKKKF